MLTIRYEYRSDFLHQSHQSQQTPDCLIYLGIGDVIKKFQQHDFWRINKITRRSDQSRHLLRHFGIRIMGLVSPLFSEDLIMYFATIASFNTARSEGTINLSQESGRGDNTKNTKKFGIFSTDEGRTIVVRIIRTGEKNSAITPVLMTPSDEPAKKWKVPNTRLSEIFSIAEQDSEVGNASGLDALINSIE